MDKDALTQLLTEEISKYLNSLSFELVDLILRHEGNDLVLRIFVDRPEGGITIGECAKLNNDIGRFLDEGNLLTEPYVLEVSSPGLDRPLVSKNDFKRNLNKMVKFFLKEKFSGKLEWDGIIKNVNDETVSVDVKGQTLEIPLIIINKGKPLF